jgi:hypothetical protein
MLNGTNVSMSNISHILKLHSPSKGRTSEALAGVTGPWRAT